MIVGWDISTSAIGVCVKRDDGSTVKFDVIYPVGSTHLEKHRDATRKVRQFLDENGIVDATHFVEERLGGFTGGLTTKQTLMVLAAMNAVISLTLSDHGPVTFIAPVTTKRITGLIVPKGGNKKLEVVKLARSREPSFPYAETKAGNYVKGTDDMADAWLLAEAGLAIIKGEASIGRPKKARRGKGKARGTEADRAP